MRRVEVVVNAAAGSASNCADVSQQVNKIFREAGWDVSVAMVQPQELMKAIESAAEQMPDVLVVGGGDGTIRGAASIAIKHGVPLGILAMGTMNLLAKDLRLPLEPIECAKVIASGLLRRIDAAEVNGSVYLHSSILGLVPQLGEDRERIRDAGLSLDMPRSVLRMFQTLQRAARLHVEMRGKSGSINTRTHMLAVVNNPIDEERFGVFSRASVDAGILNVYAFRHAGTFALFGLAWSIVRGRLRSDPAVLVRDVHEIEIHMRKKKVRVSNDGEVEWMRTPLRYRIRPKALEVIVSSENVNR